jgi:antitoxin component of MazEF toxin-antitoxin module
VSGEGASFRVTLPRPACKAVGLTLGDHVAVTVVGHCLVIVRVDDAVDARVLATTNELINGLMAEASR